MNTSTSHIEKLDDQFQPVKSTDNFYGVAWSLRGSRGPFSGRKDWKGKEYYMMNYHNQVWPKKAEPADPVLVLGEDEVLARMQLKDGDEKAKGKGKKKSTKPKLGQAKRGVLVGGEPGPWTFWTEDRHLRDWVLSAQGDAFGS